MELKDVQALIAALQGTDVTSVSWRTEAGHVVIRRAVAGGAAAVPVPVGGAGHLATVPVAPAQPAIPAAPEAHDRRAGLHMVLSPFVGTFYRKPSPDQAAYVEVGSKVGKGQTLCIVEAMKLLNEIESDTAGVVMEILVENEQTVEYGQPLFAIKPE